MAYSDSRSETRLDDEYGELSYSQVRVFIRVAFDKLRKQSDNLHQSLEHVSLITVELQLSMYDSQHLIQSRGSMPKLTPRETTIWQAQRLIIGSVHTQSKNKKHPEHAIQNKQTPQGNSRSTPSSAGNLNSPVNQPR
jgi:hypothetical protein